VVEGALEWVFFLRAPVDDDVTAAALVAVAEADEFADDGVGDVLALCCPPGEGFGLLPVGEFGVWA
jgi:hypothetical protein